MRKSKVLLILDEFYPTRSAPSVRINSFIKELSKESNHFEVFVLGGSSGSHHLKKKNYCFVNRPSEKKFFSFVLFLIKINLRTFSLARKQHFETIVLSIPKYELLFVFPWLKRKTRILVLDVRDSINFVDYTSYFAHFFPKKLALFFGNLVKKMIFSLWKRCLQAANLITVANEGIFNSLANNSLAKQENCKHKCIVVSNGVDVDLFTPQNKKFFATADSLNLVYVGNFAEKDRFDFVYNMDAKLRTKVTLNLIGSGRNKHKVVSKLRRSNINFKDYGFVENTSLPKILNSMDIGFIFRSNDVNESIPVAMYEFCSMNILTITNNVGIMARFVNEHKVGFVIEDQKRFDELLWKIISSPSLLKKFGKLHELAREKFSREEQAKLFCKKLQTKVGVISK